jgi:NAD(P)H-dependent flavin oxidoreductase YrpB (nitropropane dioxygenase family)
VDVVLMGAGIPSSIPGVIARLARWEDAELRLSVEDNQQDEPVQMRFSPRELFGLPAPPLRRPQFLAIVSSHVIAKALQKKANGPVDGFVIEDYTAGGHNAPPRKARRGEAVFASGFSSADVPDLAEFRALGVPFWLAGSCATPERLRAARAAGAAGVQIGTPFAFCDESAILPELKRDVVERAKRRRLSVVTDFEASPTGYPFKRIVREEQPEEIAALRARARVCDLGYLRRPYHDAAGRLGYRCAGEPVQTYLHKGGDEADTANKLCLCNQLLATIGLAQERDTGVELPLLTAGEELSEIARFVGPLQSSYTAGDVIRFMQGRAPAA